MRAQNQNEVKKLIYITVDDINSNMYRNATALEFRNIEAIPCDAFANAPIKYLRISDVKQIESGAFQDCDSLEVIEIDTAGVCNIHKDAFSRCHNLKSITLTGKINLHRAFAYTSAKKLSITVSEPHFLSNREFMGSKLEEVCIDGEVRLAKRAFMDCSDLKTFSLHNNTSASIPEYCFCGCENLADIKLPETINIISSAAFARTSLKEIPYLPNLSKIKSQAFENTRIEKIILGESIVHIGAHAFSECENLKLVDLSRCSNIKAVSSESFDKCDITDMYLPKHVKITSKVGRYYETDVFTLHKRPSVRQDGIENIYIHPESPYYKIIDDVVYSYDLKTMLFCLKDKNELVIPEETIKIAEPIYNKNLVKINRVIINHDMLEIGPHAFGFNSEIGTIEINGCVKQLDVRCFANNIDKIHINKMPRFISDTSISYSLAKEIKIFGVTLNTKTWDCNLIQMLLSNIYNSMRGNKRIYKLALYIFSQNSDITLKKYIAKKRAAIFRMCIADKDLDAISLMLPFTDAKMIDSLLSQADDVEIKVILEKYKHEHFKAQRLTI